MLTIFNTTANYSCLERNHYFDYPVPHNLQSFYYSTNIKTLSAHCNAYGYVCILPDNRMITLIIHTLQLRYWEVTNGWAGETCHNMNTKGTDDLWCETITIPACAERTINCTSLPYPANAKWRVSTPIISSNKKLKAGQQEMGTKIVYSCPMKDNYFDYPLDYNFGTFKFTNNINKVIARCTKNRYKIVTLM
jgi:hypothetical protein